MNACTDNQTLGCQRDGAFSTYFVMPEERIYDGKGLPAKTLAAIEPFCIGYHGAKRADIKPGERVLVIGAGTIGVVSAISAKSFGAEVTICDVAPQKLEMARQFGVDHVLLNDSPESFEQGVRELTNGDGFDVAIEAVGLPNTFMNCIDAVCFGGRVVDVGVRLEPADPDGGPPAAGVLPRHCDEAQRDALHRRHRHRRDAGDELGGADGHQLAAGPPGSRVAQSGAESAAVSSAVRPVGARVRAVGTGDGLLARLLGRRDDRAVSGGLFCRVVRTAEASRLKTAT